MPAAQHALLMLLVYVLRTLRTTPVLVHPRWCDRSLCEVCPESDGSTTVFHIRRFLDDPGPIRVELYGTVTISRWGRVRRDPERLYVDEARNGTEAGDAARLAEAVTRAALSMAGVR